MKHEINVPFFAPEVIQSSGMDCGPAALKALLQGHGIQANYARLREACHTAVDGTSVESLEALAQGLGLDASETLVPVDHLLMPEAAALPALVVTQQPSGLLHFVVLWRVLGPWVQIMDPGRGRRWLSRTAFLREVAVQVVDVPSAHFAEWASTPAFLDPLRARARRWAEGPAGRLVANATREGWRALAALDAALRTTANLAQEADLSGAQSRRLFQVVWPVARRQAGLAGQDAGPASEKVDKPLQSFGQIEEIPAMFWAARPLGPGDDGDEGVTVQLRGAVLLQVAGHREDAATPGDTDNPSAEPQLDSTSNLAGEAPAPPAAVPELEAVLQSDEPRPGRRLWQMLTDPETGLRSLGLYGVVIAAMLAGLGTIFELVLFRGFIDLTARLPVLEHRLAAVVAVVGFVLGVVLIEWPLWRILRAVGRRGELSLRARFLRKIPLLGERYFQSRPIADMAERAHAIHSVRVLASMGGKLLRAGFQMIFVATGLILLYPEGTPLVVTALCLSFALPVVLSRLVEERDLRLRSHVGSLAHFYLDGLLGLVPIRAHAAESAVAAAHRERLVPWAQAARSTARTVALTDVAQTLFGYVFAVWLLTSYFTRGDGSGWAVLIFYWGLYLPVLGEEVAYLLHQYPRQRNLALRLFEPLDAPEAGAAEAWQDGHEDTAEGISPAAAPNTQGKGVSIAVRDAVVVAAGQTILKIDRLDIPAGSHVAVVGASGAGKSSLVGVLLGWHRPSHGQVLVDGRELDDQAIVDLRAEAVWIDPGVQLWNRSLLDNLRYGAEDVHRPVGVALEESELDEVLNRLPVGLQTLLGEGGATVSGGEGQRVRFGRGVCRGATRLVVLDEAFRGLERPRRVALLERARHRWHTATLVCVTHDIAETADFDRVLVIDGARIVEDGAPIDLMSDPHSRYARLRQAYTKAQSLFEDSGWREVMVADGKVIPVAGGESAP